MARFVAAVLERLTRDSTSPHRRQPWTPPRGPTPSRPRPIPGPAVGPPRPPREADVRRGSTSRRPVEEVALREGRPSRRTRRDTLATEEPLEIRVARPGEAAQRVAVTMRTPGPTSNWPRGSCSPRAWWRPGRRPASATRGPWRGRGPAVQRRQVKLAPDAVRPRVAPPQLLHDLQLRRLRQGLHRGRAVRGKPRRRAGPAGVRRYGARAPGSLREAQAVFERTGGLHAAALFTAAGELLARARTWAPQRRGQGDREHGPGGELPLRPAYCWSAGALSFELVQKAALAGIAVLAGGRAP